jgi:hypothetical protein
MRLKLDFRYSGVGLTEAGRGLVRGAKDLGWAMSEALTRGATQMRTKAVKQIREIYNVPAARIRSHQKGLLVFPASAEGLSASLVSRGMKLPLIYFGARPSKPGKPALKGASVQVKKESGRTRLRHAFVAPLSWRAKDGSGGTNIHLAWRSGEKEPRKRPYKRSSGPVRSRLPLEVLTGPSIPSMLANQKVRREVLDFGGEAARVRFASNLNYLMFGRRKL